MSNRRDAKMNGDLPRGRFPTISSLVEDVPKVEPPADSPGAAIDVVDVALARQELLAAANASNALGRAIIRHLMASITGRAKNQGVKGSGGRSPAAERQRR